MCQRYGGSCAGGNYKNEENILLLNSTSVTLEKNWKEFVRNIIVTSSYKKFKKNTVTSTFKEFKSEVEYIDTEEMEH